jgi:DNA-binding HxlR family transcriptional regulator
MRLGELLKELGGPSQTTLRGRLTDLVALDAVAKRGGGMPYSVENELTPDVGRDLLQVVEALAVWLSRAPAGPIPLGSVAAKGAIKALVGGWESTMLRAFAARPLSLTQLDRLIVLLSYPSLERRLSALRVTGLVEPVPNGARAPYAVSRWGREAVGPISAAARFERIHMLETATRLTPIDVEAAFLLATPIARLPRHTDGFCQLAAETDRESQRLAGVNVAVDRGTVVECVARLDPMPRNRALGDADAWLHAMVLRDPSPLRIRGDEDLSHRLVLGVHDALFSTNGQGETSL